MHDKDMVTCHPCWF